MKRQNTEKNRCRQRSICRFVNAVVCKLRELRTFFHHWTWWRKAGRFDSARIRKQGRRYNDMEESKVRDIVRRWRGDLIDLERQASMWRENGKSRLHHEAAARAEELRQRILELEEAGIYDN